MPANSTICSYFSQAWELPTIGFHSGSHKGMSPICPNVPSLWFDIDLEITPLPLWMNHVCVCVCVCVFVRICVCACASYTCWNYTYKFDAVLVEG